MLDKVKMETNVLKYYTYRDQIIHCSCGFEGFGFQGLVGDITLQSFYLNCPKCKKANIAAVLFPTKEQVEKYGTPNEKNYILN